MRADIGHGAARAGARRIGAPVGLLLARLLERRGQPVLRILDLDHAQPAEPAVRHHGPGLADHGVGRVVVGQHEHPPGPLHQPHQLLRVRDAGGQRLVAQHVDAGLEERPCGRQVQMVGRHDRDHVDAVRAAPFLLRHLGEGGVGPLGATPSSAADARDRSGVLEKQPATSS